MSIRAWVFDLGNTLMSIPAEHDEELRLQEILGYSDTEKVRSIIYRLCSRYPGQSIDVFLERFDKVTNPSGDKYLREKIRDAWINSTERAVLSPGALSILDRLRALGMKLALVSNTPPTSHLILDKLDLRRRFDDIVFSCDVGYLKPDPRIFRAALNRVGVPPAEAVVVGDKIRTDILGGAILGLRSVLLETRLRAVVENGQNYVDAIIPSLLDLPQTLLYRSMGTNNE